MEQGGGDKTLPQTKPKDPHWNVIADINGDNIVDIYDAILFAQNYGKTT
jgi:hypothetical protein